MRILFFLFLMLPCLAMSQPVNFGSNNAATGTSRTVAKIQATYYTNAGGKYFTFDANGIGVLMDLPAPVDSALYATRSYVNNTFVPLVRTITINGNTQDLSADRAWTIASDNTKWTIGGNALSSVGSIGSTTAQPVTIKTNDITRDSIAAAGVRRLTTSLLSVFGTRSLTYSTTDGTLAITNLTNADAGFAYTNAGGTTIARDGVSATGGALAFSYYSSPVGANVATMRLYPQTVPGPKIAVLSSGAVLINSIVPTFGAFQVNGGAAVSGTILQGTSTDNLQDGYQSPNTLRALRLKATQPATGTVTDSVAVYNATTDDYRNVAPIYTLTDRADTVFTSAANITLPSTIRTCKIAFTGTTATWTLPTVASSYTTGRGVTYFIKNRGTGDLIINTTGAANEMFETVAVNTITVDAWGSVMIMNDGTFYDVSRFIQ